MAETMRLVMAKEEAEQVKENIKKVVLASAVAAAASTGTGDINYDDDSGAGGSENRQVDYDAIARWVERVISNREDDEITPLRRWVYDEEKIR
ncbi:hypothetical protein Dimus_034033, partial [Dionaea muscipula]